VAQKALAIKIVLELYNIMLSHPDGWTLMLGMPSGPLLNDIMALRESHVMMESAVSAEVRRFQRAVGMTSWDIITAHNRSSLPADTTREGAIRNWATGGLGTGDAAPSEFPAPPRGVRGRIFKQTTIASYKLLPDDAITLMDAMEYEQDVWAAEAAAYDSALLARHSQAEVTGLANQVPRSPKAPRLGVWVMNSGASLLRASVGEFAPHVGARKRGPKVTHPVFAEVFPRRLVDVTPAPLGLGLNDVVEEATGRIPGMPVVPSG